MPPLSLQILSDTHLEARGGGSNDGIKEIEMSPYADVLALLGDIGSPLQPSFCKFIDKCANEFKRVFFVHGNHELYNQYGIAVDEMVSRIQEVCDKYPNVSYLNNQVEVYEGVCFIGSTLWSHVPQQHKSQVTRAIRDYRNIYKTPCNVITVDDTNAEYVKNKTFLESSIGQARSQGYWPVILTHHAPWLDGTIDPRYKRGPLTSAFATDLASSSSHIQLWAAGHTHYNFDTYAPGYRLISNQHGEGRPISGYQPKQCILLNETSN